MSERWKQLMDSKYWVSDHGRVISYKQNPNGRAIKGTLLEGYRRVQLSIDGKRKDKYIHILVAELYVSGKTRDRCFVDHMDGIRTNNHFTNLRWVTRLENAHNRKMNKNNTSGVNGVSWCVKQQKFQAYITVKKKMFHLGFYHDIQWAEIAVLEAKLVRHTGVLQKYRARLEELKEEIAKAHF